MRCFLLLFSKENGQGLLIRFAESAPRWMDGPFGMRISYEKRENECDILKSMSSDA
jgi:hypothetical protein